MLYHDFNKRKSYYERLRATTWTRHTRHEVDQLVHEQMFMILACVYHDTLYLPNEIWPEIFSYFTILDTLIMSEKMKRSL